MIQQYVKGEFDYPYSRTFQSEEKEVITFFVWVSIVLCAPVAPTRRRSWFVFELMVFGAGLLALP
jgi:hypothetical protein